MMLSMSISLNAQSNVPVFLQKNGYAKDIANVFSLIEEGKLSKAEKEWEDIIKRFDKDKDIDKSVYTTTSSYLYPIWDISRCVLMNTQIGRDKSKEPIKTLFNPWSAYNDFKVAINDGKRKVEVDEFFKIRKLNYSTESIKSAIEENLVNITAKEGTEQAYDKLISTLYDYSNIRIIETKREQIAFSETMKSFSVLRQQQYLDKYKVFNTLHHNKITHRRDSLAFEQLGKSADDCKQYLRKYPHSEYIQEVEKLLHKYEFDNLSQTVSACMKYLSSYPKSEYVNQVKKMMAQYAYDDVKKERTMDAYGDFLRTFGQSEFVGVAKQELNRIVNRKFLSDYVNINELKSFISNREFSSWVDYKPYETLYANLRHLPTSSAMMECKDLTGEVNTHVSVGGNEYDETYVFSDSGLLIQHRHSRNGQNDTWDYSISERGEVKPISKTDNRGKVTTFKTTFNEAGLVAEISGSDGTGFSYTYNSDNSLKTISYSKAGRKYKIDTYEEDVLVKSDRNGISLVYEYNGQGDVIGMTKKRGSIAMEQTTYEYEYDNTGSYWRSMEQFNNGSYFLAKRRSFITPDAYRLPERKDRWNSLGVSNLSSNSYNSGKTSTIEVTNQSTNHFSDGRIFDVVDQMPSFPGGMPAMMQWLSENINYPVLAVENGVQGRVIVQFVVEKDGSVTDVSIAKSVEPSLDKEAIRVVSIMPRWNPGKQNGSPVRVKYTVPVMFSLK